MNCKSLFSTAAIIAILFTSQIVSSQQVPDVSLSDKSSVLTKLADDSERKFGFSIGGGYVKALSFNNASESGFDFFLHSTGNLSDMTALRGGLGLLSIVGEQNDLLEFYMSMSLLLGRLNRSNSVNYYGLSGVKIAAGLKNPSLFVEVEDENYFGLEFLIGGGLSFGIQSTNSRFYIEPVKTFASYANTFTIRVGLEF